MGAGGLGVSVCEEVRLRNKINDAVGCIRVGFGYFGVRLRS